MLGTLRSLTIALFFFRSKFSFKVTCYMLELYNDKLIDLLAPHGKEVSFELLRLCVAVGYFKHVGLLL